MKKITAQDVHQHRVNGPWRELERLARIVNESAAKAAKTAFNPVLGGGTRLMLAMDHRISDDVDLFISDPQWLGYLSPRLNDVIEDYVTDYHEDTTALKMHFAEGEIDYIVSSPLLGLPNEHSPESCFELEPPAEVLAKKLFYRGYILQPRDLFDWRMIEMHLPAADLHLDKLAIVLAGKLDGIAKALDALGHMPPDHLLWTSIRTPYPLELQETVAWAKDRVEAFRAMAADHSANKAQTAPQPPTPFPDNDTRSP